MTNANQAATKRLKMSDRAEQQLQLHFPNFSPEWIWRRKSNDGYTTLPRTLPIVMQAVDDQSKGQPAGHTLFCLWARSPDHPLVTIENPATFAAEAGFDGVRAVDTWRRRMKRLRELRLILTKKGASGDFHYVLLMNPNVALEFLKCEERVQTALYARFLDRLTEIGGYRDLERAHALWAQMRATAAQNAAAAAAIAVTSSQDEASAADTVKDTVAGEGPAAKKAGRKSNTKGKVFKAQSVGSPPASATGHTGATGE